MRQFFLLAILTFTLGAFAQKDFQIVTGPYLQAVTDTEATVVWTTSKQAVSWVELAPDDSTHFYNESRPRYYNLSLGKKLIGTIHRVRLQHLEPGKKYRYRIYSQEVIEEQASDVLYGKTIASQIFRSKPFLFQTLDKQKTSFSFLTVNDIHEKNDLLKSLLGNITKEKVDFVFYNGDMVNNMQTPEKILNGFLNLSVEMFASELPFYISRGNHETRGLTAGKFMDYFPTTTGKPYFTLEHGNTFFIVLDGGEDKPDTDIEYGGLAAYDQYRIEEQEWLKKVVQSEAFKSAKHKIVMMHIPPGGEDTWHGPVHISELFVPVLNGTGIDLMLCGHIHRHNYYKDGVGGTDFPVLINAYKNKARVDVSDDGLVVKSLNDQNKAEFEVKFQKR